MTVQHWLKKEERKKKEDTRKKQKKKKKKKRKKKEKKKRPAYCLDYFTPRRHCISYSSASCFACTHVRARTHAHTHTHTYIHTRTHTHALNTHTHTRTHTRARAHAAAPQLIAYSMLSRQGQTRRIMLAKHGTGLAVQRPKYHCTISAPVSAGRCRTDHRPAPYGKC